MKKQTPKFLLEQFIHESMKAAFVDPFADIFKTAAWGIKDLSQRTQGLFKVFFKSLPSLMIPFMEFDYKQFREEEDKKLSDLREKYADVLKANDDVFYNSDIMPLAFLMNPTLMLGGKLAVKAPEKALQTLEILTGGFEPVTKLRERWQNLINPNRQGGYRDAVHSVSSDPYSGMGASGYGMGDTYSGNTIDGMTEAAQPVQPSPSLAQELQTLLKNPEVVKRIQNNPLARRMQLDVVKIWVEHVFEFMKIKTVEELLQKHGSNMGKIRTVLNQEAKKVPKQEFEKLKVALLVQAKSQYKNYYIEKLQELAREYPNAQAVIQQAITKIQSAK